MTDSVTAAAPPAFVDVAAQPGRRVRDQEGALLPENHILRGVPRTPYWLRLERDGDVMLTAHDPDAGAAAAPATDVPAPVDVPALPLASGERGRRT